MERKLVCIQKIAESTDLLRQSPGHSGYWEDIEFTEELVSECDYLVIINMPERDINVMCPPGNVWAIMQEPPNEVFKRMHRGRRQYSRIYTQDPKRSGSRYKLSQPAIAWHVERDYDWLVSAGVPDKTEPLSWITSSITSFRGHKDRMRFLEQLQSSVEFDLYGRGFNEITDKWDGLAPYRYSLAVENYSNPWYWTEKIADCFLSWTMPIYFGCNRITEYFPPESLVYIDIHDPDCVAKIEEIIHSDRWHKNQDAIKTARQLILDQYQLLPVLAREIHQNESEHASSGENPLPVSVRIPAQPLSLRIENALLNSIYKTRRLFNPDL